MAVPSVIDRNTLVANRDELQRQSDALGVTISEATEQQTALNTQVEELTDMINYIDGGSPDIPNIEPIIVISATAGVPNKAVIDWTAVADATGYVFDMSLTPDFSSYTEVFNDAATVFEVPDLQPGVTYYFRGYGKAPGFGNGEYVYVSVLIKSQLATPANFGVTLGPGDASFIFNYDLVDNAQSYKIYMNDTNNFNTATQIGTSYTDSLTITNEEVPGTYYFFIVASAPLYIDSDFADDNATTT